MFVIIPTINSKTSWGEDFGSHLNEGMWERILLNAKKITCSNKCYKTQYMFIHRQNVTLAIRCKYDSMCSSLCSVKCKYLWQLWSNMVLSKNLKFLAIHPKPD